MKPSETSVLLNNTNHFEQQIISICNNRFSKIEFERDYEPEIKLKILFDKIGKSEEGIQANEEIITDYQDRYLAVLYGILRRYEVHADRINLFYHIILALELIRPDDNYKIIKQLIVDEKFLSLALTDDKFSLHIKLIDIYMDIVTKGEDIDFMGNYLMNEVRKKSLFVYPNFFSTTLRFYGKFKNANDFFTALEQLIPLANDDDKIFRLIVSLEEFIYNNKSVEKIYKWINRILPTNLKKTELEFEFSGNYYNEVNDLFLLTLSEWVVRKYALLEEVLYLLLDLRIKLFQKDYQYDDLDKYFEKIADIIQHSDEKQKEYAMIFNQQLILLEQNDYFIALDDSDDANIISCKLLISKGDPLTGNRTKAFLLKADFLYSLRIESEIFNIKRYNKYA